MVRVAMRGEEAHIVHLCPPSLLRAERRQIVDPQKGPESG